MRTTGSIVCLLLVSACTVPAEPVRNEGNSTQEVQGSNWVVVEKPPPPPSAAELQKCLIQDGEQLRVDNVKAIGTEPFWAAEVDGRCVTYKTPEDQEGTRFWTRVAVSPRSTIWNGSGSRQFQLTVTPAVPSGCSDGMSDKIYPLTAVLRIDGETRNGCAETL